MDTPPLNPAPPAPAAFPRDLHGPVFRWFERNFLELGHEVRLSYLPPLMVYLAAGLSGLISIAGTFFIKEHLALSAEFLAALAFWGLLPWVLKMPVGHLVDLMWRHKAGLVYFGALLVTAGLLIMVGLLADLSRMRTVMSAEAWFVVSTLLMPIGYMLQDCVADAMTAEAVPRVDEHGQPLSEEQRKLGHTTMQTLGRVAIIGGTVLVALANVILFSGAQSMSATQKTATYLHVYEIALLIPALSVFGVLLAAILRRRAARRLRAHGFDRREIAQMLSGSPVRPEVNWWIIGGGIGFAIFSVSLGLSDIAFVQEIVFSGSLAIVLFLMWRLMKELDRASQRPLFGTALVIFAFRSMPTTGAGSSWWMIDVLKFDQQFIAVLALIGSGLTLAGLFLLRRFMAERSVVYTVGLLTVFGAALYLPNIAMFYGFHEWTSAHTHGVIDARFIALIDTALESPLGQVAMIPMLAWIANCAPDRLKATYFAVMTSFINLAVSLSQLLTKYINQIFVIRREVRDAVTGAVQVPADYSQVGYMLIAVSAFSLIVPLLAILFVKFTRFKSA